MYYDFEKKKKYIYIYIYILYFHEDRLIRKLEISSKKFMDLIGKTDLSTQNCDN